MSDFVPNEYSRSCSEPKDLRRSQRHKSRTRRKVRKAEHRQKVGESELVGCNILQILHWIDAAVVDPTMI